ncbi:hypothetical protein DPX16_13740 [Anabarilius grahami]|uniref:Uncharacterized protein n=1 Tax=Anabarilius grahami TaxID=495550 RepID=A0A3N0XRV6_ANAGA|nr:hypothetical protein DPX16_13740 [Anabarilius grahami]
MKYCSDLQSTQPDLKNEEVQFFFIRSNGYTQKCASRIAITDPHPPRRAFGDGKNTDEGSLFRAAWRRGMLLPGELKLVDITHYQDLPY